MKNVSEYSKFFLKKGLDSTPDTFDGNMKLQKLLFFANLIHLEENDEYLFEEEMLAFEGGTVIEEVRQRYRNDYIGYKKDANNHEPNFCQTEYDTLNKTIAIFGKLPAKELSSLNHEFNFWKDSLAKSTNQFGYHSKENAVIQKEDVKKELSKIRNVLDEYNKNKTNCETSELVNGITFYFNPTNVIIDQIILQLEDFSKYAEDNAYTIYLEEEELVIL